MTKVDTAGFIDEQEGIQFACLPLGFIRYRAYRAEKLGVCVALVGGLAVPCLEV